MKPLSYLILMLVFLLAGFLAGVCIERGPATSAGLLAAVLSIGVLAVIAIGRWWINSRREDELKTEKGGTENG